MKKAYAIMLTMALMAVTSARAEYTGEFTSEEAPYYDDVIYFDDEEREDPVVNFSIGYVNKDWETDFGSDGIYKENLWGEPGKHLHGIQMGIGVEPHTRVGLGVKTGIYYEGYISVSPEVERQYDFEQYMEHSLYVPLHAMWRIPVGRHASLTAFGGLGVNWAICGTFSDNEYVYTYDGWENIGDSWDTNKYGHGDWPKSLNLSWEAGASLRIKSVEFKFTYSNGITDHQFYSAEGPFKTKQQKLGLSIGLAI